MDIHEIITKIWQYFVSIDTLIVANNIVMHNSEGYTADPCNAISLANFEDSFDLQYNVHKRGREPPKTFLPPNAAYKEHLSQDS